MFEALIPAGMILLAFVPVILAASAVVVWVKLRQRRLQKRGVRHPLGAGLLRPPGYSTWEQFRKLDAKFDELLMWLMLGPILGLFALPAIAYIRNERLSAGTILIFAAIMLIVMMIIVRQMMKTLEQRGNYRLGWEGELAAAEELNRVMLNGHRVYHDVPGDGFNIDHVVVSTSGVFAFETKTRTKRKNDDGDDFKVIYDGKTLNFSGYRTGEPLLQAKRQARWLRSFLTRSTGEEVYVRPAVIVPGWWVERPANLKTDVSVLNAKEAVSLVRHGGRLDEAGVQRVCFQLEQLCRGVELSKPLN